MTHAFFSYVREDSEVVDEVAAVLRSHGVKVWLDRNELEPGSFWKDAIAGAIGSGAFFIAFFSEASNGRAQTYMNEELTLALEQLRLRPHASRWFIPVLVNDVQIPQWPFRPGQTLRDFQAVRLFTSRETGIAELLRGLGYDEPGLAEEKLLLELLTSRFPAQREYAQRTLCSQRALSANAEQSLIDAVFTEPRASMQTAGAQRMLESKKKDPNRLPIAERLASHPNGAVRLLAYEAILDRRAKVAAHALAAIADKSADVRRRGIKFFGKRLARFPQAIPAFGLLLDDREETIRYRAIETLLGVEGLWTILPSDRLARMAELLTSEPTLWRQFGQFAERQQTVPAEFKHLLLKMAKSADRDAQNSALGLIPHGRSNFIGKELKKLKRRHAEEAMKAAHRLGLPENRCEIVLEALEATARSDERPMIREAASRALNGQAGIAEPPLGIAPAPLDPFPVWQRSVQIINHRGLDTRPCAKLISLAARFDAQVYLWKHDAPKYSAAASETIDLLMLGAACGECLVVGATGPEAFEALDAIIEFIEAGMGDAV